MTKTIQGEIQQTRPFPSLRDQVVVNLMRTLNAVAEPWVQYLKRTEGLSASQYNLLRILRGAQPDPVRICDIGARLINRDPDVTRLVDRLVQRGLASRAHATADRRVVLVEITDSGIRLLARLDPTLASYNEAAMGGLDARQLQTLDTLLNELRAGIRPAP